MNKGTKTCKGSLTLYMEADDGTIGKATYWGAKYPKFGKRTEIKNKTVKEIEVQGDCCWDLYPRRRYNGVRRSLHLGSGHHRATIQPKSLKKGMCM